MRTFDFVTGRNTDTRNDRTFYDMTGLDEFPLLSERMPLMFCEVEGNA